MSARLGLVAMILLGAVGAEAANVRGTLNTILGAREAVRGGNEIGNVPLVELIALEVNDLSIPGTDSSRVVLQGWGRLQLSDDTLQDNTGDLGLLFLDVQAGRLRLRAGRQYTALGVGRMTMMDGLHADVQIWRGLHAQAYAGFTVHPELRSNSENRQAGGRVAWSLHELGAPGVVGVAFRRRCHRGILRSQQLGADAAFQIGPTHWSGIAVMDLDRVDFAEGRLAASVRPIDELLVTLDAERVRPDLLVAQNSIFSVFADAAHDSLGADAAYDLSPYWSMVLALKLLRLDGDHLGYRGSLRAVTYREAARRSFIGAEIRRAHESDYQGYTSGRAFTRLQITEELGVSADAFLYGYDKRINGEHLAVLGQASVIYDIRPNMRLAASFAGGSTPWAEHQVEGMLRFAYGYEVDFAREVAP
jgi:hypothetical protein